LGQGIRYTYVDIIVAEIAVVGNFGLTVVSDKAKGLQ
jgi:hypothetical protein